MCAGLPPLITTPSCEQASERQLVAKVVKMVGLALCGGGERCPGRRYQIVVVALGESQDCAQPVDLVAEDGNVASR